MNVGFHHIPTHSTSRLIGAAIALVIGIFVNAGVEASCGDYLHVGTAAAKGGRLGQLYSTAESQHGIPTQPSVPFRCNGPNCSRHLPPPAAPEPSSISSRVDEQAVRMTASRVIVPQLVQELEQAQSLPRSGYPLTINRPPQI